MKRKEFLKKEKHGEKKGRTDKNFKNKKKGSQK